MGSATVAILAAGCTSGDNDQPGNETDDSELSDDSDDTRQTDDSADDGFEPDDDGNGDDSEDDDVTPPEPEPEPESETLDDFANLGEWDVINGSFEIDDETFLSSPQGARMTVDDEQHRGAIERDFHPPIDLQHYRPQLAVQTDQDIQPWIQMVDIYGNRIDFRTVVRGGLDFQYFDFGIDTIDDEVDLGAIETIRIVVFVGEENTRDMRFDQLRITGRPRPGIVMIHLDDVVQTQYTHGFPILEEYGIQATAMINPGYLGRFVGGRERMRVDELQEVYDAGWDVGNHGLYHQNLVELDPDEREAEVRRAHQWLVDNGFDRGADYFAYPYAMYDQDTLDLVAQDHDLAFTAGWPSLGRYANPLLIHRAHGDPSADDAISEIDLTANHGGITTLYYHDVSGDMEDEFEAAISHLASLREEGRIRVMTVSELGMDILDDGLHD